MVGSKEVQLPFPVGGTIPNTLGFAVTSPSVALTSDSGPSRFSTLPRLLYAFSRILVGTLLVAAGITKVANSDPVLLAATWVIPSIGVVLLGIAECFLGWAVLTFVAHRLLRYLLTLLFAAFIGVLLIQWQLGVRQCPCLAGSGTSVGTMILFDVLAISSLVFFRSHWDHPPSIKRRIEADTLGSLHVVIPSVLVAAVVWFGSINSAVGFLAGRSLLVDRTEKFIGEVEPNKKVTATFQIRNASSLPVRILGASASCRCVAVDDLPVTILSSETKSIRVALYGRAELGVQRETAALICNDSTSRLLLGVTVLVRPNPNSVDAKPVLIGEKK